MFSLFRYTDDKSRYVYSWLFKKLCATSDRAKMLSFQKGFPGGVPGLGNFALPGVTLNV
jgi:hypothetical protein